MIATENPASSRKKAFTCHAGHAPDPPQITIIGAMAMSGTVCDATTNGINSLPGEPGPPKSAPSASREAAHEESDRSTMPGDGCILQ